MKKKKKYSDGPVVFDVKRGCSNLIPSKREPRNEQVKFFIRTARIECKSPYRFTCAKTENLLNK